jgi:ABC-type multidrug transport system fused ATPase/permease subunit
LVFLLIAQVYFILAIPQCISNVVDLVPTDGSSQAHKPIVVAFRCLLLILYVVLLSGISVATTYLSNHITSKFAFYIRQKMFIKVNKLSLNQINKISIPSII